MCKVCRFETKRSIERIEQSVNQIKEFLMSLAEDLQAKLAAINTNTTEMAQQVTRIREVLTTIKDQLANGITPDQAQALVAQADEVLAATDTLESDLVNTGNE